MVSEGYANRSRGGMQKLLDLETARAAAEHLTEVHDALRHGEGVSGRAARRLIQAADEAHHRFGGIVTTPRQADAKVRSRGHVPDSERKLREELAHSKLRAGRPSGGEPATAR